MRKLSFSLIIKKLTTKANAGPSYAPIIFSYVTIRLKIIMRNKVSASLRFSIDKLCEVVMRSFGHKKLYQIDGRYTPARALVKITAMFLF